MSKKQDNKSVATIPMEDPTEVPFREFKDSELSTDYWGMGPSAFRATLYGHREKAHPDKNASDQGWKDEQIQPVPRSVRHYLCSWMRAEELALSRYEAEVVIFDDNDGGKISAIDFMFTHTQVLLRSSFCRRALSVFYMLERYEGIIVEHQWDGFSFTFGLEGWRPKYHIYSPGLKAGGGPQHRPVVSKNGCYLVRLYYLGCWRCIWVNDLVPMDASGAPLLPFSPMIPRAVVKPVGKQPIVAPTRTVQLWPLLLCKALLKLAVPDMTAEDKKNNIEDEDMDYFDIIHALTGGLSLTFEVNDLDLLWALMTKEVPNFSWDDDDETVSTAAKAKLAKKPTTKDAVVTRRPSMTSVLMRDTKDQPPFIIPGVTPAYEMLMMVTMTRDIPIKKPLPEPDVPQWKTYRWVDWAKEHGLYGPYECPRTKFLKCTSLLKLSYSPHLLDMQSTESITFSYKDVEKAKKTPKELTVSQQNLMRLKEEFREWISYEAVVQFVKNARVTYFPSMLQFASAFSVAPMHPTKGSTNKSIDLQAPKHSPLYIQIDSSEEIWLKISFNVLHPRVLFNCRFPLEEYVGPGYLFLELFDWFENTELPEAKAYLNTRSYDSLEISFKPGRHFCRLWVHSELHWHAMLVTDSNLLMGTKDQIQVASEKECTWTSKFLFGLSTAFSNWLQKRRSQFQVSSPDKDFFKACQPDLEWNDDVVGYPRPWVHWMFRKALQSILSKRLTPVDYRTACTSLRKLFLDPDFGLPDKPPPPNPIRDIIELDSCDCEPPVVEEAAVLEENMKEEIETEEKPVINDNIIPLLLKPPQYPNVSQLCELATEEVPCDVLRIEREKAIKRHEAATVIQSHWRRAWAQKCINGLPIFPVEVQKAIMDSVFGNLEALQTLMNEFFSMFPGTRSAYSVASGLSGVYGLQQYVGTSNITPQCKWVPFFQTAFYCHHPVKVNFDLNSNIMHSTFAVYNNDDGKQLQCAFNFPLTYDFHPNNNGYTVIGHGVLDTQSGVYADAQWQLTVLSSLEGALHMCDSSDFNYCKEQPVQLAQKLHIDEIFLPNRRNVLGGIQMIVSKTDCVSFRACASSPEMEIVAILKKTNSIGTVDIIDKCTGKGEIYWPFIILEGPVMSSALFKKHSLSTANLVSSPSREKSERSAKSPKTKSRMSTTKISESMKMHKPESRVYTIEVIVPDGWPLSLDQWVRIEDIRNTFDVRPDGAQKKPAKERASSAKDKQVAVPNPLEPQPGDAYVELEMSVTAGGGIVGRRDDERELEFAETRRQWEASEPGRNARGALIRKEFRDEYLVVIEETCESCIAPELEEIEEEHEIHFNLNDGVPDKSQPAPTPVSEIMFEEMLAEAEEETLYLELPEQLKDKFEPLYFVPLCTREPTEEKVLVTPDKAEAGKMSRNARLEAALERMRELQLYYEIHVMGRQKKRCLLVEKLFVDAQMKGELIEVFDIRDEAAALEGLANEIKTPKKK